MNKTLVVIQCRMNSKRLPGKAVWPLSGIPVILFLIRRLVNLLPMKEYKIILATTTMAQDDILAAWAIEEGITVIRGDANDVMKRYLTCLDYHPADTVVRVTADNPLTCPEMIMWLAQIAQQQQADYVFCTNVPQGSGVDVFSSGILRYMNTLDLRPDEREHINLYILNHKKRFKTVFPKAQGLIARPDLRMTIDTREDWEHIGSLFLPKEQEPWNIGINEIIKRMDQRNLCRSTSVTLPVPG